MAVAAAERHYAEEAKLAEKLAFDAEKAQAAAERAAQASQAQAQAAKAAQLKIQEEKDRTNKIILKHRTILNITTPMGPQATSSPRSGGRPAGPPPTSGIDTNPKKHST